MDLQSKAVLTSQAARALRHWSSAALERARGPVERVWSTWCDRWQLTCEGVSLFNACDRLALSAAAWHRVAAHPLWLSTDAAAGGSPADAVNRLLFEANGAHADTERAPIAQEIAVQAMADLVRSLSSLVSGNDRRATQAGETPPGADARRWSGAVVVRLRLRGPGGSVSWTLHCGDAVASELCGASVEAPLRARAPLTGLMEALRGRRLSFSVRLQETPLTLGSLQSLRIGDVLPLAHRLDEPLRVVEQGASVGAPPFCAAFLGSHDNFRAVELIPAAAASQSSTS